MKYVVMGSTADVLSLNFQRFLRRSIKEKVPELVTGQIAAHINVEGGQNLCSIIVGQVKRVIVEVRFLVDTQILTVVMTRAGYSVIPNRLACQKQQVKPR